jgi:hypothetical protein
MIFSNGPCAVTQIVESGKKKISHIKTAEEENVLFPFRLRSSRENFTFVLFSSLSCLNQTTEVKNIKNSINCAQKK